MSVQLEETLSACREEASLTEDQLQATRELVTILLKYVDLCNQQQEDDADEYAMYTLCICQFTGDLSKTSED